MTAAEVKIVHQLSSPLWLLNRGYKAGFLDIVSVVFVQVTLRSSTEGVERTPPRNKFVANAAR